MFKLIPDPTFTEDIELTVPGQIKTGTLKITFKYKTEDELEEFTNRVEGKPFNEVLPEIMVGWSGIPQEYNEENLTTLLKHYPMGGFEIYQAYFMLIKGTRVKNSKLLP